MQLRTQAKATRCGARAALQQSCFEVLMFSLIALYFAHRRMAATGQMSTANVRALAAANEQEALAVLPLAA
ncbi:hypothetical protein [uncultured Sphingomonas sp.]|uniref:hypothetical protein n=1 Tax=uncultured Sphingomonas sp. TaxID=158754 RepID=UPI0025E15896|nr:hypothetical protein [uncultured Sphingomonas sp.]